MQGKQNHVTAGVQSVKRIGVYRGGGARLMGNVHRYKNKGWVRVQKSYLIPIMH